MTLWQLLFLVGSLVGAIGAARLLWAIVVRKKVLRGYSPSGSLLTALAVTSFEVAFILSHQWAAAACNLLTVVFWWVAALSAIFYGVW